MVVDALDTITSDHDSFIEGLECPASKLMLAIVFKSFYIFDLYFMDTFWLQDCGWYQA